MQTLYYDECVLILPIALLPPLVSFPSRFFDFLTRYDFQGLFIPDGGLWGNSVLLCYANKMTWTNFNALQCLWIPCVSNLSKQAYARGKHRITPPSLFTSPLCASVGVWGRQTMLSRRARALKWCKEWNGCLKRGGLGGIQISCGLSRATVCGKTS